MKYKDYKEVDFLKDDFFVEWVKRPTPESSEFWKEFLAAHQEQRHVINRAKLLIVSIEYAENQPLERDDYIEMFENILKKSEPKVSNLGQFWSKRILKIAAVFVLLFSSFIIYYGLVKPAESPVVSKADTPVKSNPKGQKSLSVLPDGTKVKLNSESSLIIDASFGDKDRRVKLSGEAFFNVTRNIQLPFIIETNEVETRVLGTSFNVRSYIGENNIEILVVTGEVSVSDDLGNSIVLNPNELLEYDRLKNNIKKSVSKDLLPYIGWKDGILVFENDPFQTVVEKVERWYDVEISLPKNFRIPGDYTATYDNKSLERVMDGWSFTSKFTYSLGKGKKIFITHKK